MLVLLPLLVLALALDLFRVRRNTSMVEAVLCAGICFLWGVGVGTEILGLCQWLTRPAITVLWTGTALLLAILRYRSRCESRPATATPFPPWAYYFVGTIFLITLATGLFFPPNNFDSQAYHLPRVEHWIANHSLAFYLTGNERQLSFPPLAEIVILHFKLLSGTDRLDNLVQWLAMLGTIVGVVGISRRLTTNRHADGIAAVLAASVPMAILQSSSTQNDAVLAFALVGMCERMLACLDRQNTTDVLLTAMAAGAALAIKGTAYIFAFPFLAAFAWIALARRLPLLVLLACPVLALAPSLGLYWRNIAVFGVPLGMSSRLTNNAEMGIGILFLNFVRNITVNLVIPLPSFVEAIQGQCRGLFGVFGLDPADPRATYPGFGFFLTPTLSHEDFAGAPVLLVAAMLGSFCGIRDPRRPKQRQLAYMGLLAASILLFLLVVRWQPWIARLQLPLCMLGVPLVALAISRFNHRVIILAAAIGAVQPLLFNTTRPLVALLQPWQLAENERLFFRSNYDLDDYRVVVDLVRRERSQHVGLVLGSTTWEYPLWRFLAKDVASGMRIEHICIPNHLGDSPYPLANISYPQGGFQPDIILVDPKVAQARIDWSNRDWRVIGEFSSFVVLLAQMGSLEAVPLPCTESIPVDE